MVVRPERHTRNESGMERSTTHVSSVQRFLSQRQTNTKADSYRQLQKRTGANKMYLAVPTEALTRPCSVYDNATIVYGQSRGQCKRILTQLGVDFSKYSYIIVESSRVF
jgi:hypothetical protein